MPDVFALLSEDHRKVEALFQEFESSGDPQVALEICGELTIHAVLEEELVYPVLAIKIARETAEEARHEHQEAKQLVSQIEAGVENGDDISGLVQELKASVEHHVQEEETEIFPKMEAELPTLVETMGADVVQRKQELMSNMADAIGGSQRPSTVGQKPMSG
ncbi:MAG: hemerythrin domain-containing protein [Acidimicrobiales bacterium]